MIRIILADDHPIVRQGVAQIISNEPGLKVVAEAGGSAEALDAALGVEADVLVLDLSMPGRGGLEVLKDVRRLKPSMNVLVLSMYSEQEFAARVIKAGALGYLTKNSAATELVKAIRLVARGERYVSAVFAAQLAAGLASPVAHVPHTRLSDREHQVFVGLAAGKSPTALAEELALSVKTVSTYRARVLEKLEARTNADLVRYAVAHALLP